MVAGKVVVMKTDVTLSIQIDQCFVYNNIKKFTYELIIA